MKTVQQAIQHFDWNASERDQRLPVPFDAFLEDLAAEPFAVLRNAFQVFHDMIKAYVTQGLDEYPDDPESINFVSYDCSRLFIESSDHPFFADRLFANRLIGLVEALKRGLSPEIVVREVDAHMEEPAFANVVIEEAREICV